MTAALAIVAVATRLPLASTMLYSYDSANYAFAVRDYYHVGHHQPHPPGYPLYVWGAWLIDRLLGEPNRSLVVVSVLGSVLAVVALHRLAVELYGPGVALASALLLLASPAFWGYGTVAYPYTALAGFAATVALLSHRLGPGTTTMAAVSGLVFGVGAGFRWDLLPELGVVWVLGLWRCSWRARLLAVAALVLAIVAWAVPMVLLSGGLEEYMTALRAQSGHVVGTYSILAGGDTAARYNADVLAQYLRLVVGTPLVLLVYAIGRLLTPAGLAVDGRSRFLLAWIAPSLAVLVLVHVAHPGYLLAMLPALCLLAAVTLSVLAQDARQAAAVVRARWPGFPATAAWVVSQLVGPTLLALLVAWNTVTFFRAPGPLRLPEIRHIERLLRTQVDYVRTEVRPETALVLAHDRFRQLQYYLVGYRLELLFDEHDPNYRSHQRELRLPPGTTLVLVMDGSVTLGPRAAALARTIVLTQGDGGAIQVLDTRSVERLEYGYGWLEVVPPSAT